MHRLQVLIVYLLARGSAYVLITLSNGDYRDYMFTHDLWWFLHDSRAES